VASLSQQHVSLVTARTEHRLYGKSASLICGSKLFHSPGPAAAKALSPKVLWVWVTSIRMPGSLWSVVVTHERRRQDDSHQLSMTQNFRTATDELVSSRPHLLSTNKGLDYSVTLPDSLMMSQQKTRSFGPAAKLKMVSGHHPD